MGSKALRDDIASPAPPLPNYALHLTATGELHRFGTVTKVPQRSARRLFSTRNAPFLHEGKGHNPPDLPGSYFFSLSGRSIRKSTQLSLSLKNQTSKSSRVPNLMFRIAWYGGGTCQCSLPTNLDHPYRFSIHLAVSESLIFPRYRCVVERFECRRITLLTISMGTPDLEACVAACLLRSCGLSSIPASFPAFLTIILAAA